jgi:S-adenosylmethionine:tRNA ribosyltransferase-isomerase
LDRQTKKIVHKKFFKIIDYFNPGDVLVLNDSKVIPARLLGRKDTGGKVEIFLLNKISKKINLWDCLIKGKIKIGQKILLPKRITAEILSKNEGGDGACPVSWQVKFSVADQKLFTIGQTPTPPYIKEKTNLVNYQTIYAKEKGSVAAPTAGLHFTKKLLANLRKKGVKIEYITLHVGLGTFAPVKTNKIEDHKIHRELAAIDKKTARELNAAKINGHKIIACGTTAVRTLEAFTDESGKIISQQKWVDIFIYPGYKFKFVDQIITNCHLPKSTLLMLISAFAGRDLIMKAYREAIKEKYKFYSFGDAMLIK